MNLPEESKGTSSARILQDRTETRGEQQTTHHSQEQFSASPSIYAFHLKNKDKSKVLFICYKDYRDNKK